MTRNLEDACSRIKNAFPSIKEEWEKTAGGLVLKAISVLRSTEEQERLFAQGRTAPGKIVTSADGIVKKSKHQKSFMHGETASHAMDLGIFDQGGSYVSVDSAYSGLPRLAILGNNIRNGYKWGDLPHFECCAKP